MMSIEGGNKAEPAEFRATNEFAADDPVLTIDYLSLFRTLRRGLATIVAITLAAILLALGSSFLIRPEYTSTASFLPPGGSSGSGAAALAGQLSQLSGLAGGALMGSVKSPGDLYIGLLKSRSVASSLVKRFDLMNVYKAKKESRAEKKLADNSKFEVGLKDTIVTVSVTDKNASRARDIAAAYLDALHGLNGRLALSESSQRRLFFGDQLAKEKDALADAEVDLRKTEEQTGFIAPIGQTQIELQTNAETRAQIAARQVELSALRQSETEENPDIQRLKSEIEDLQGQLARLEAGGHGTPGAIPTSRVPQLGLDYIRKEREVKYHEALFEILAKQYASARMDEAHEAPLLQVIDPPSYPDTKSWPNRTVFAVGGLIAGLIAGAALVLVREHQRAGEATPEAVSESV